MQPKDIYGHILTYYLEYDEWTYYLKYDEWIMGNSDLIAEVCILYILYINFMINF